MDKLNDLLALGVVIFDDGRSLNLEAIAREYGHSRGGLKDSHFIIYDEVIYDPLGVLEAAEHIVKIRCRDMPVMPRIKPNNYAGDSWRRQGKRRGSPRR
jgi:hypothetical protein